LYYPKNLSKKIENKIIFNLYIDFVVTYGNPPYPPPNELACEYELAFDEPKPKRNGPKPMPALKDCAFAPEFAADPP
jgi:hypothetical protein